MRDFNFYTSTPMTAASCYNSLITEIKNIEGSNAPDQINIRIAGKHRAYLWFNNDRFSDLIYGSNEELEEDRTLIPINDPYINHFEAYRSIEAKRVVKVIMAIYPELYVEIDDNDWRGTAKEFLETEFDF